MKWKAFLSILGICSIGLCFVGFFTYKHHTDIEQIKKAYVSERDQETEAVARTVEYSFKAFYQGLRTMTLLPGVREIDRYGQFFEPNSKQTMQQIYNNTYLNVTLSEVYILPSSLDPDNIDPVTGKPEEPILTFDEFIVGGAAKHGGEGPREDEPMVEETEIFEYRLMKKQLEYLRSNYPTDRTFENLEVPAVTGEPVITCDHSEFTKADLDSGNNRPRMGIVLTLPIYGNDGKFRGGVSGVVRTNVLEKLLPKGTHALVNLSHGYIGVTDPIDELTKATENFQKGQSDAHLIYSTRKKLNIVDSTVWELWVALPDSAFNSMTSVRQANLLYQKGVSVSVLLTLAAIAVTILVILAQKREYEQKDLLMRMQAENLKLEQEKNKVLLSLHLETESKFSLASEVAHRLNNPLNYIKTALGNIDSVRSNLWQKCMSLLDSADEESAELIIVRNEYKKVFGEFDQAMNVLNVGVEKASDYIGDIRGLSGVDGFSVERNQLDSILKKVTSRLVEYLDRNTFKRLNIIVEKNSQTNFYCNKHLLKACLEMIFHFFCRETSEDVTVHLIVSDDESVLKIEIASNIDQVPQEKVEALKSNVSHILKATGSEITMIRNESGIRMTIIQKSSIPSRLSA